MMQHIDYIKKRYREVSAAELGKELGFTAQQVKSFVQRKGIKSGRTGQFHAGHKSHNKGVKGWNAGGNSSATRFKKGVAPHNTRPVGSTRICSKDGYIQIKVAEPRTWRLAQRVVWEEHNGKIPAGHKVWFKDNNRTNIDINNLMLITYAESAVINKLQLNNVQAELKIAVLTLAQITLKRGAYLYDR